jgi:hypothetical protein
VNPVYLLLCVSALAAAPTTATSAQQFESAPTAAAGRSAQPVKAIPPAELLAELRKGGYVIYFRHTSTDFSRDDARSKSDDDCDNQRPLTDKGREEARQIGSFPRIGNSSWKFICVHLRPHNPRFPLASCWFHLRDDLHSS